MNALHVRIHKGMSAVEYLITDTVLDAQRLEILN